jgi:hypothetical protein
MGAGIGRDALVLGRCGGDGVVICMCRRCAGVAWCEVLKAWGCPRDDGSKV